MVVEVEKELAHDHNLLAVIAGSARRCLHHAVPHRGVPPYLDHVADPDSCRCRSGQLPTGANEDRVAPAMTTPASALVALGLRCDDMGRALGIIPYQAQVGASGNGDEFLRVA